MAQLMGAPSFAHYTLNSTTLAGSPEAVESFLQELLIAIQPKVSQHRHQQPTEIIALLHGVLHHTLQAAIAGVCGVHSPCLAHRWKRN